jgi:hypothetical protein
MHWQHWQQQRATYCADMGGKNEALAAAVVTCHLRCATSMPSKSLWAGFTGAKLIAGVAAAAAAEVAAASELGCCD